VRDAPGDLVDRCHRLRALHVRGDPLVLPNAWDATSARAVEAAGFAAVATTSGGVAASLGYDDHEDAPVEEMLAAAGRMVRSVAAPVTVDFEAGYGLAADELAEALQKVGAAGINIEDTNYRGGGLHSVEHQAARVEAIRRSAEGLGYPLVINARIDLFLVDRQRAQSAFVGACIDRARAYLDAGADCVYPIFLSEPDARRAILSAIGGPVNLLMLGNAASVQAFAADGVARVSYGAGLHRQTMNWFAGLLEGCK
jgi:2-methylisocitrate lyase-like PEP mutase family enzyme